MLFRWYEHNQIYHPQREHDASPKEIGLSFEDVYIGEQPKIHGWFFPARTHSLRKQRVMLVCHGNGGNMSHRVDYCDALLQTGVNVFIFDYRGYGNSSGRPDEEGTYQDAQAAYRWLKQKGFDGQNIVAIGESLGGGVAAELAIREKLGGLILQSTFTCIPDIGSELINWLPVRWICSIHYNTSKKLPKINVPVMVMHSRQDRLIGFHHAEKNFTIANEPKFLCEIYGDHNDPITAGREQFVAGIEKLLSQVEKKEE